MNNVNKYRHKLLSKYTNVPVMLIINNEYFLLNVCSFNLLLNNRAIAH